MGSLKEHADFIYYLLGLSMLVIGWSIRTKVAQIREDFKALFHRLENHEQRLSHLEGEHTQAMSDRIHQERR